MRELTDLEAAHPELAGKAVQYLWRRLWGQNDKAAKSLLVFVGLLHFLRRGLGGVARNGSSAAATSAGV